MNVSDLDVPVKSVAPTTHDVEIKHIEILNCSPENSEVPPVTDLEDTSDYSFESSDSCRPGFAFEDDRSVSTTVTDSESNNPSEEVDTTAISSNRDKDINLISSPLPTPFSVGSDSSSNDSPLCTPIRSVTRRRKYTDLSPQSQTEIRDDSPDHKHLCSGDGILVSNGTSQKSQ